MLLHELLRTQPATTEEEERQHQYHRLRARWHRAQERELRREWGAAREMRALRLC
ncbi:hypothetical protein FHX37_0374 [Haloactinospora alba]|uniref:Uncharacterized protein n=1 Tax=Haloactinospora alba TaxID=405555 RepID=A0A543NF76_9ACTN|nr:hypothetical protein [Haloactinospora alba]TQN30495.1 hypothetical protein FHX37_0374 [Haloactinospora alba]